MDDKKLGFLETIHNVVAHSADMQKTLEFLWKNPELAQMEGEAFRLMFMHIQSLLWCQSELIKNLVEAELTTDEYVDLLKEKLDGFKN